MTCAEPAVAVNVSVSMDGVPDPAAENVTVSVVSSVVIVTLLPATNVKVSVVESAITLF